MSLSNLTFNTKSRPYQYSTNIVFGGGEFWATAGDWGQTTTKQLSDKISSVSVRGSLFFHPWVVIAGILEKYFQGNCNCREAPDSPVGKRVAVILPKLAVPMTLPGWPGFVQLKRSKHSKRNCGLNRTIYRKASG